MGGLGGLLVLCGVGFIGFLVFRLRIWFENVDQMLGPQTAKAKTDRTPWQVTWQAIAPMLVVFAVVVVVTLLLAHADERESIISDTVDILVGLVKVTGRGISVLAREARDFAVWVMQRAL
jgi:hypothetical protein